MGIQALPHTTVRTLGASQVLPDPAALVKELVDNALDANATSIAIEIHSNTVDVIQVRDDGHGIAPEDRSLAARRYCTSKISHEGDLTDIGGSSLGFRGEALASAAELSGSLTISTRVAGEQVAVALKINQQGEVAEQEHASLPVGTTVRISQFIKANPVRRQVVLKNVEGCLKKIKCTLQAYAFARPHVRLSLRVLKAKNNKGDWLYAPKPSGTVTDAAFKIVGSACASQCVWSELEDSGFIMQAFTPRLDSDASKTANIGSFLSVDARPVSAARGVLKQVVKIFREALRNASAKFEDVKDPFLFLEINCPKGSYDANVEPAKDDVLFEDASVIVEMAKKLFTASFPRKEIPTELLTQRTIRQKISHQEPPDEDNFITSLEVPVQPNTGAILHGNERCHQTPGNATAQTKHLPPGTRILDVHSRTNMYGCDEEDLDLLPSATCHTQLDLEELPQEQNDVDSLNPWVLPKLHSSVPCSRNKMSTSFRPEVPADVSEWPSEPILEQTALPTPRPSSPLPQGEGFHLSGHASDTQRARNGRISRPSHISSLELRTPMASDNIPNPNNRQGEARKKVMQLGPGYDLALNTADASSSSSPLHAFPGIGARPRCSPRKQLPRGVNRPFVPPHKEMAQREKVWFDNLQSINRPRRQNRHRQDHGTHALVDQGELGDLLDEPRPLTPPRRNRDIRDFVNSHVTGSVASLVDDNSYLTAAIVAAECNNENIENDDMSRRAQQPDAIGARGFIRASELVPLATDVQLPEKQATRGPKRRKTSERRALQEMSTNAPLVEPDENAAADEDSTYQPEKTKRAPSRRQSSSKLGRKKSSRLPLERVPAGQGMHNVVHHKSVSHRQMTQLVEGFAAETSSLDYNEPAHEPRSVFVSATQPDVHEWTISLHDLLIARSVDREDAAGPESLFNALKAALAQQVPGSEFNVEELMASV